MQKDPKTASLSRSLLTTLDLRRARRFVYLLLAFFSSAAMAYPQPAKPTPTPVPLPSGPSSLTVNPDTLRERLLSSDIQIFEALTNVEIAKSQVDTARANLLPSFNISALTSGNFLSAGISILLPFLQPGNWFNLAGSKNLLYAQGMAFNASIYNLYANAESSYLAVVGDQKSEKALEQQLAALGQIVQIVQQQVNLKLADPNDLAQAKAAYDLEAASVLTAQHSLEAEYQAVINLLGLPVDSRLKFEDVAVPASKYEANSASSLINYAVQIAPENQQLNYLVAAGKDSEWSASFGWLGTSTLNGTSSGSTFSVGAGGSINLGFQTFPAVALAKENVQNLGLQQRQLVLTVSNTVATSLDLVSSSKKQVTVAKDGLVNATQSYNGILLQYKLGLTDLLHVLQAHQALTQAIVQQIQSAVTLNTSRVALHRTLVSDQFQKLPVCQLADTLKSLSFGQYPMEKACGLAPLQ